MTNATRDRSPRRPANRRVPTAACAALLPLRAVSAEGRAGSVGFHLQRVAGGLYVEREDIPRRGLRTIQSIAFSDPSTFERWCDGDPVRFEHPLLHAQLKRAGGELWNIAPGVDAK